MKTAQSTSAPKLWIVLARTHHALVNHLEKKVTAEGLCLSDFAVLEVLLHKGPMTMSAISEKVLLANASMTSAVDRLDERCFARRKSSDEDRRVRVVELTARGRKFISALYERHERDLEAVMSGLSGSERNQLCALLKKLGYAAVAAPEKPANQE